MPREWPRRSNLTAADRELRAIADRVDFTTLQVPLTRETYYLFDAKTIVIAIWNLFLPEEAGEPKDVTISLSSPAQFHLARISRLDAAHGSLLKLYDTMGRPVNPTPSQLQELRHAAELPGPELGELQQGKITLRLPPQGLALIELQ